MLNSQSYPPSENIFLLYKQVRSALKIPLKTEIYFDLLEYSLTQNINEKTLKNKQAFSTEFIRAFLTLSKKERQQILLANISSLYINYHRVATIDQVQQQNRQRRQQLLAQLSAYDKLQNCEGKCQILIFMFGIPYWQSADFNLQAKKRIMSINANRSILLDLRLYLVRKSKKHDNTLVLESVSNKTPKEHGRVSLSFKESSIFDKVHQSMFNCIVGHRNNQLIEQFRHSQYQQGVTSHQNMPDTSGIQISVRPLVFLNEKNINDYLQNKKTISTYLSLLSQSFFPISQRNQCTIFKSSMDSSFYKLQNTFHKQRDEIKQTFLSNLNKYSFIKKYEVLESFSHKYQAIYQKYYIRGRKIDQIIIQEAKQQNSDSDQILIIKHVDSIVNKSFMQFCIFNLEKLPGASCKLSIYGCFNPILLGGPQNLILMLEQYVNIVTGETPQYCQTQRNQGGQIVTSKDQFFTVLDEFQGPLTEAQKQQIQKQIKQNLKKSDKTQTNSISQAPLNDKVSQKTIKNGPLGSRNVNPIEKYLFHKYLVTALPKESVPQKIQKSNWLQVEWKRAKGGGLVCKNQKVIEQQRKLYKKLLVSFGQQIIKTKGILNLSLPVIMFKKQSQLHSMAKTFKMAPFFLEKAAKQQTPIEKFKQTIAAMTAINALNLSFEKPFNPILGQTLQMTINGCPLYVEQISHHPPITSYYFIGRGYKLYGTAAIKIDIGLNNAKGYSQLAHTLQFDDGHKIQFIYPKLLIGGLLFGQRTFNFEGKNYIYDAKNKLYADMYFGQIKKTFFASETHPQDQVSGSIYQMKPSFDKFYNAQKPLIDAIDKNDIEQQLQKIDGIWNQSLKIGGKAYTQFIGSNIDPIYELQEDQFLLPSDSRYRMDLKYLVEGKVEKAQDAKVQLQELQRRDKKLRREHAQKGK